jgi:hypothetical protein
MQNVTYNYSGHIDGDSLETANSIAEDALNVEDAHRMLEAFNDCSCGKCDDCATYEAIVSVGTFV